MIRQLLTLNTFGRNLVVTLVAAVLAALAINKDRSDVAMACIAFISGLWLRSGRQGDGVSAWVLIPLALTACRDAGSGIELGVRVLPRAASALAITTDQVTMLPQASPACPTGRACIYAKIADNRAYVRDAAGVELQSNAARAFRPAVDCAALASPALGDVCYDSTEDKFQFYAGSGWTSASIDDALVVHKAGAETITGAKTFAANVDLGANRIINLGTPTLATDAATKGYVDALNAERSFVRTCTLTSAVAISPVNCLADLEVGAAQRVYLVKWHAKVNGATPWAGPTNCWIQDTSGVAVYFVTIGVAALAANAFIADHSASVTQNNPYALGTGGTLDLGLEIACDNNGTGSDLVVTLNGVIK